MGNTDLVAKDARTQHLRWLERAAVDEAKAWMRNRNIKQAVAVLEQAARRGAGQ